MTIVRRRPAAGSRVAVVRRLRDGGCVFAEDEASILLESATTSDELEGMIERRVAGEPLEHVVGWAEFCGLRVSVDPGVFVPRRRTEFLAQQAAEWTRPGQVVVDLCCGTGAVGLAVLTKIGSITLHASDLDPAAVACARRNLEPVGGGVHEGDLFAALPSSLLGRVDVVVANGPYVPSAEISLLPTEARVHESQLALDGGFDGLGVHRRIAAAAGAWLSPGGRLLVETSQAQAASCRDVFASHGFSAHVLSEADATIVMGESVRD